MTSGIITETASVLASVRRHRAEAAAAEVRILLDAVEWARLHEVTENTGRAAATWGDTPIPLAGEGAPLVADFCISEFSAACGWSRDSGSRYIAHALELAHRLPLVFERVVNGELPVYKARRIAEKTLVLSAVAAAYVDRQVAPIAHKISYAATERLVAEAIDRCMPDLAAEQAEAAADRRRVQVDHTQVSFDGTSQIYGELDLADALDLEAALQAGAQKLKEEGSGLSLDARRAAALGALARGEGPDPTRDLVLFVHHTPESGTAYVENAGGKVLSVEQVKTWCTDPRTRVSIKPVIDLNAYRATDAYEVPDAIREQVVLRDGTCSFPYCNRNARRCDIDHVEPYEWDGTPEQTNTDGLAPLCRGDHRRKTHGGWTYRVVEPGTYLWRSPHGHEYLRDQTGTRDLTPRPVDPPG